MTRCENRVLRPRRENWPRGGAGAAGGALPGGNRAGIAAHCHSGGRQALFPGSDWHFSVSHTPRRAFCALSRREIGIDAEELDRNVNLALAEKILSPGERVQFDAAPDKRRALLTFWVLKEAQVKRTGDGLRGYPNGTDFSLNDPRVTEMDGCLVAVIE